MANRSPIIAIYRGVHDTHADQTLLGATILSVYQHHVDTGLSQGKFCVLIDQIWHKFRGSEQELIPLANRKHDGKIFNKAELVLKVVWTATTPGFAGTQDPAYKAYYASELAFNSEQEVNIGGFRLERFRSFPQIHNSKRHLKFSDDLPITVISHLRDDIFASDVVEQLLMDPTHINWASFPNVAQAFFVPTVYSKHSVNIARLVLLWADPTVTEQANASLHKQQSDRRVAELDIIHMYASLAPGNIYLESNPDTRARYRQLGAAYDYKPADFSPSRGGGGGGGGGGPSTPRSKNPEDMTHLNEP